jgi:hypothetical protein
MSALPDDFLAQAEWAADSSPLYERLCRIAAGDPDLLELAATVPETGPRPTSFSRLSIAWFAAASATRWPSPSRARLVYSTLALYQVPETVQTELRELITDAAAGRQLDWLTGSHAFEDPGDGLELWWHRDVGGDLVTHSLATFQHHGE